MPKSLHDSTSANPAPGLSSGPNTELNSYLQTALSACDGASQILNRYFGNLRHVDEKFQAGLVSEADKESEAYIVDLIRKAHPDHVILGEESGLSNSGAASSALWMIDPLDGTTNYIHQFPVFCISIGLEIDGELVMGVVDAPKLGRRYQAVKGGGAFCNGEPIRASTRTQFRDGLFATGFFETDPTIDEQLKIVRETVKGSRGIRRAGAAAMDLCFVAEGIFDAFWETGLKPWDTAAGVVIAREAGAIATEMNGKAFTPRSPSVACGAPAQHANLLERIARIRSGQ